MIRRSLTSIRQGRTVTALRIGEDSMQAPAPGAVLVKVAYTLVDREPLLAGVLPEVPEAAFVGTVETPSAIAGYQAGTTVVGVGPMASVVLVPPGSLLPLSSGDATRELALLPFAASVSAALGDAGVASGDNVVVSGKGLAAWLAKRIVQNLTKKPAASPPAPPRPAPEEGEFDILIDTTADPRLWPTVFPLVRRQGRVLLLLPPGPQVAPFDFYQRVHRGSLALFARRVPAINRAAAYSDTTILHSLLDGSQEASSDLFKEVRISSQIAAGATIDLNGIPGGKGLICAFDAGAEQAAVAGHPQKSPARPEQMGVADGSSR